MTAVERVDRRPPVALTDAAIERFLETLRAGLSATAAAAAGGFHRASAYRRRVEDSDFAAAWQDAREEGVDRLIDEAVRRASVGVERAVYGRGGEIVGTVTEYSDRLMEVLLRGLRPEVFGTSARLTVSHQQDYDRAALQSGPTLGELAEFLRSIGAHDHPPAETSDLPQLTAGGLPEEESA